MTSHLARLITGDALAQLKSLASASINCCVTSPPYWQLRDYGVKGQLGLEKTPEEYVSKLVKVFEEVRRVLKADGTLWLNLGDTYASDWPSPRRNIMGNGSMKQGSRKFRPSRLGTLKDKDLVGIPWRVAFALQRSGWYLRSDIIWQKPDPMPESVKDRPTRSHEYVFLFAKSHRYLYNVDAIREPHLAESLKKLTSPWKGSKCRGMAAGNQTLRPSQSCHPLGRNKRTVWTIPVAGYRGAHFSVFPEKLVEPCILAGCPKEGTVLDPFAGVGTTLLVASQLGRNSIGIEINDKYVRMAKERMETLEPGAG